MLDEEWKMCMCPASSHRLTGCVSLHPGLSGTQEVLVAPLAVEVQYEMLKLLCPLPQMFSAGQVVTLPSARSLVWSWPFW